MNRKTNSINNGTTELIGEGVEHEWFIWVEHEWGIWVEHEWFIWVEHEWGIWVEHEWVKIEGRHLADEC